MKMYDTIHMTKPIKYYNLDFWKFLLHIDIFDIPKYFAWDCEIKKEYRYLS